MVRGRKRLRSDEAGRTAIEFAIMVAGIAVVIIAVVFLLGGRVRNIGNHRPPNPPAAK